MLDSFHQLFFKLLQSVRAKGITVKTNQINFIFTVYWNNNSFKWMYVCEINLCHKQVLTFLKTKFKSTCNSRCELFILTFQELLTLSFIALCINILNDFRNYKLDWCILIGVGVCFTKTTVNLVNWNGNSLFCILT